MKTVYFNMDERTPTWWELHKCRWFHRKAWEMTTSDPHRPERYTLCHACGLVHVTGVSSPRDTVGDGH